MAETKRFIETPVDRTPYGSCAYVALLAVALWALGAAGLWNLGRTFKQHGFFHLSGFSVPHFSAPSDAELLQQVKDAAAASETKVQQQASAQQKALQQKAADQAKVQVQTEADQAQRNASQDLQNYLK